MWQRRVIQRKEQLKHYPCCDVCSMPFSVGQGILYCLEYVEAVCSVGCRDTADSNWLRRKTQ